MKKLVLSILIAVILIGFSSPASAQVRSYIDFPTVGLFANKGTDSLTINAGWHFALLKLNKNFDLGVGFLAGGYWENNKPVDFELTTEREGRASLFLTLPLSVRVSESDGARLSFIYGYSLLATGPSGKGHTLSFGVSIKIY